MIAAPYYLISAGDLLFVVGALIAAATRPTIDQTYIDPRMNDREIEKRLNRPAAHPVAAIAMMLGFIAAGLGVIWRLVRMIV